MAAALLMGNRGARRFPVDTIPGKSGQTWGCPVGFEVVTSGHDAELIQI